MKILSNDERQSVIDSLQSKDPVSVAVAIEEATLKKINNQASWEPEFDVMAPEQEDLAVRFCNEISGLNGGSHSHPDPVRLLEMAQALYIAERKHYAEDAPLMRQIIGWMHPTNDDLIADERSVYGVGSRPIFAAWTTPVWGSIGRLIDASNTAKLKGFTLGSTNWAAFVCSLMGERRS